jgi:hypothetical protein
MHDFLVKHGMSGIKVKALIKKAKGKEAKPPKAKSNASRTKSKSKTRNVWD